MTTLKPNCEWPRINAKYIQQLTTEKKIGVQLPRYERMCWGCQEWRDNTVSVREKFMCPACLSVKR